MLLIEDIKAFMVFRKVSFTIDWLENPNDISSKICSRDELSLKNIMLKINSSIFKQEFQVPICDLGCSATTFFNDIAEV
jgi:hypothetical protein